MTGMLAIVLWILVAVLFGVGGSHAHRHARNLGGFSWRRLVGISRVKYDVGRAVGIPTTASGRRRKVGAMIFKLFGF